MNPDDQVCEIVARWLAARDRGETLSVEQLCQDCPELTDEVRGRIRMLDAMHWLDATDDNGASPEPSRARPSTHDLVNAATIGLEPASGRGAPTIGSLVRYVGDYELLAEIARGGMGVVFKARQVRLKRVVALKMILAGRLASEQEVRRFQTEAEAAAHLEHPHIVPIFEVGEQKGLHYFSMGYVDGPSLASRLVDGPLPAREAATMLRSVAKAVHYAHEKGVIHRDLKPGNILIDKQGEPRVTDFGLAKRVSVDAGEMTGTGQILGTASYMPPEQALGQPGLVREPADIYALGAVLYAMLTGRPPFQADNPIETLRQVVERDPVPPRQLNPSIPLDLETICLKCLEKNSTRRYASAQAVADELQRFLEGRPILARPVSPLNRASRWCKRNRVVASLLTAVAASLIVGMIVSDYFKRKSDERANENLKLAKLESAARIAAEKAGELAIAAAKKEEAAKREAEKSAEVARKQTRVAQLESANLNLNEALAHCERGEPQVGLLWMAAALERATQAQDSDLADSCRSMAQLWLPQTPRLREVYGAARHATTALYGPEDKTIILSDWAPSSSQVVDVRSRETVMKDGLRILDAKSGQLLEQFAEVRSPTLNATISPDQTRILLLDADDQLRIWSLAEKKWVGEPILPEGPLYEAQFSPDNWRLITATVDGAFECWNALDGKPAGAKFRHPGLKTQGANPHFCFNGPAGAFIYAGGSGHEVRTFDVNDGRQIFAPYLGARGGVLLMRNGPRIAIARHNPYRIMLHWTNGETQISGESPSQRIRDMDFSPDGTWLAEGGDGNQLMIRDSVTAQPLAAPALTGSRITGVHFSKSGHLVLLASYFGNVEAWEVPTRISKRNRRSTVAPDAIKFNSQGEAVLTVGNNGYQRLRRPEPGEPIDTYPKLPGPPTLQMSSRAAAS